MCFFVTVYICIYFTFEEYSTKILTEHIDSVIDVGSSYIVAIT